MVRERPSDHQADSLRGSTAASALQRRTLIQNVLRHSVVGGPQTVKKGVADFIARYRPDELIVTAQIFDAAGIDFLLVGDSAGNNVLGYDTTVPVTVEDMLPLVRGVVRGTKRALVIADLPFGSYQASPQQAFDNASGTADRARTYAEQSIQDYNRNWQQYKQLMPTGPSGGEQQ